MKIGIHGKDFSPETTGFIQHVFDTLDQFDWELRISEPFVDHVKDNNIRMHRKIGTYHDADGLGGLDMIMSFGGDGTFLEAVTQVGRHNIPILGINTGRLGFLASTSKNEFDTAMEQVRKKQYTFDDRTLIRLDSSPALFDGLNFALNDFAILKKDTSSMITVHAFINGEFLNSYWADGVVVSTPTGSTGYSISCGGPVVLPRSNNFIITPVSAHNLTVRPIVVPDDSELSFTIEGRSKNFLVSMDSRYETVDDSVTLRIKKESFCARLVKLEGHSYFKTLRQKLNWGLDIRN